MSKEEKDKGTDIDNDEKEEVSWYENQQNKTANIIKKYNIGTLQMFISPEILSMTSKERKKIDKIYYRREYTETPSELQKSRKEYEKELELQNKQKEQKEQQENIAKQAVVDDKAPPALPLSPIPAVLPKRKEIMVGGGFFDSDFNDSRGMYDNERRRVDANAFRTGTGTGIGTTTSSESSSLLTRVSKDSEPFIASLIKFNNSGFPNNVTIKARIDTFFNINLFKAFLKRLGEPIKLYGNDNQIVSVDDVDALNRDKEQQKGDKSNSKNKVYETDQKTQGNYITNWYPAQEQKILIGSVYAFIYTRPTEQEMKQQSELGKKVPSASMLMIKEGDNYRLIGGPIDNKVKVAYPGYGNNVSVSTDKYNSETSDRTVESQINDYYKRITGQSYLPQSISNTARRFIYEPESSFVSGVDAKTDVKDLKTVIYSRQVTPSQIESIIESSRASSTDIVKVPITTLFNILSGKTQTLQVKIDLSSQAKIIVKFLFRILEKQNLLSTISGQQKKKSGEIYENRIEKLREKLSEASLNELDSTILHNIRFILDILFSNKTIFKYKGIDYIIDYLEWNNTFKQLNKVLENYKVAYYIELELFLEKLEKGKLPIDRDGTLFSSCAVRGSQLSNFWKRNFLEQNWSRVGKQIKNSIKVTKTPSITDILPGFLKKALDVGSGQIMSQLNAGVNQISFVQYCLLGQEQLVEEFKNIDNSFAGVSWKNENSWSKRKEILFTAMDYCSSDVYCFQNVQCSLESYRTIVSSLSDEEKEILEDINDIKTQGKRIKIHRTVLNQLLEKVDDPLNLIAQIYERYKNEYVFVYFFEQKNFGGILSTIDKKTALGNLTMFKSDKFELNNETDIRMAPFISKNKRRLETIDSLEPLYSNNSFATVTYCKFKGGRYTKMMQLPGLTALQQSPQVSKPSTNLPGIQGFIGSIKVNDNDDIPKEDEVRESVDKIKDYDEETNTDIPSDSPSPSPSPAPSRPATAQGTQGGGDGSEWYNQDKSEQVGFLSGLLGNAGMNKQSKVKAEAEPCKKYMNKNYIPGGQIFGIINIKLETAETLKQIEAKQATQVTPVKPSKPSTPATPATPDTPATGDKKITKQMLEVLLIAAFVSKFRSRYYLSSSTDVNPYFMAGDFNFDIPSDQPIGKGTIKEVYLKAPALALLLTRSNNVFSPSEYPSLADYASQISDFIYKTCKILTYLYGGKGKNGRLRLIGYTNSQTLPNMFGYKYSLTNPDKVTKSELIFTTGKLLLCPKEEMNKIVNSESPEGLPAFPNKSNPSNSDAIGGVFELDTEFVNRIIQTEEKNIIQEQQSAQTDSRDAAKRSIIEQITGKPIGVSSPPSLRPVTQPSLRPTSPTKSTVSATSEEEVHDWTLSTSGKTSADSIKLIPDAIPITGEELTKLHNSDYIASQSDTVKGSPYKKSVFICETGKPDYKYLTELEMKNWKDNKDKLYSDHSPIMYKINNSAGTSQCGPTVATSGASTLAGGGASGNVSDSSEEEEMEGGTIPTELNLITWNIAGHGAQGKDMTTGDTFYYHKFNGKVEEEIEHYKSRLSNNARAITDMVNSGYDYLLVQEGPNSALEFNLNKGQPEPFNYKIFFTTSINGDGGSVKNLDVIPSVIEDNDKYYGEFYIVISKKTIKPEDIKSLGLLLVGPKSYFSNDEAATIFADIISMLTKKNIKNYNESIIKKDCSRLWFFVNSKNKQILTSVHLQVNESNTPKMYERQQQIYILLNTVVYYFRQSAIYKDFNIVFSGDYNINMLQPFPTDVQPTFLKCDSVPGQQTFIYTSKNNAPSSFGGLNEGKYNPTNIDFTLFYPKPNPTVSTKVKKVGFDIASPPSSTVSLADMQRKTKINNITFYIEKEIFKALPVTPPATNSLYNNVSIVRTSYSMTYANSGIMPAGSATILYIGDSPLNNIKYSHPSATTATPSDVTVKYMIQASPGKSGTGELITRDTLSNSVMNSLILAAINKVECIIFPFIGGELFFKELERVENEAGRIHNKNRHAEMLIKGIIDFYDFTIPNGLTNTVKKIYFCPWDDDERNALIDAKRKASATNKYLDVALQISKGKTNLIEETINLVHTGIQVNAIVNAANVELSFGSGVSSMCYAAIGKAGGKQKDLDKTKNTFIDAFKQYIKQKNYDTSRSESISLLKQIRDSSVMKLGTPRGYITTSSDVYNVYSVDGKGEYVNKKITDFKWNNFYSTKESGSFIKDIPKGTSLFYYDITKKDSKNNYIKCWFSFNTDTNIFNPKSNISNMFILNVLNPLGNEGSIVWLDSSKLTLSPFNTTDNESVSKTIQYIKLHNEEADISSKKLFIESSLSAYNTGKYELDELKKNTLIKLAEQIKFPLPDIKDWAPRKKVIPSATTSSNSVPSTSVPGSDPSSSSSSKKPTITEINGINRRATEKEFKDAQEKGIKEGAKIPGGVNDTTTYHQTGSTFEVALDEIKAGQKKTHWMWYIFPSDIKGFTPCSTFFRLGPVASRDAIGKKTITIKDYLDDNVLRQNYISITEAVYDKLDKVLDIDTGKLPQGILKDMMTTHEDPKNRVDYYKLKNSVKNFYMPLKIKLKSMSDSDSDSSDFIKKMNRLNIILNDIKDPEYKVDDEEKLEDDFFTSLGKDALDSSLHDTDSMPPAPPGTPMASLSPGSPDSPVSVESPESPVSRLKLVTTDKSRILSLDNILTLMIQNIDNNVFIINGGSFNPPHNGHVKMFESAYNTLVDKNLDKSEEIKGYYGIMVVSTRKYIMGKGKDEGKGLDYDEVLSSENRIKLCKLACDTYKWDKDSPFNYNNMLILSEADSDPKALILHKVIKILNSSSAYEGKQKEIEKIKTEHLFYLCGSDFFINKYADYSRYSIIYVLRKSEEGMIKNKEEAVAKYSNTNYLKIPIVMSGSDEYSLSSSIVREAIQKLGTPLLDAERIKLQNGIIKSIGLPVYCYLRNLEYLIPNKSYGKSCDRLDPSVSEEIESVHDFEMGDYEGFGEDVDILNDEEWMDYQIDLLAGELDDIPEKDRNIFIEINTFIMFDSETIKDEANFDKVMNDLISCDIYNKKGIDSKSIKGFLKNIYDSKIYYILNDFCYFKVFKIDSKHCFIQNLLSNGESNTNLLEGINLLSTDQFNTNYLAGKEGVLEQIVDDRTNYLDSIKAGKYKDYDGNDITKEIVDEILGFLYDGQRYSLYLYLIDDKQPAEGKRILLSLYSTVIEEKNDKVEYIVGNLNDELAATIERSKRETGPPEIPKKLRGPKGSKGPLGPKRADGAKGASELLKAVNYVQQRSNGDGNCFYNSVGMLSSKHVIVEDMFDAYQSKSISHKYKIQFDEQSRVRVDLAEFMIRIYNIIKNVDKKSKQYMDSPIIKYIVTNGDKNNFKYVSTIKSPIGSRYYGTDSEIYFASLYYKQPIVTVTGISDVSVFNVFYWDDYRINDVMFTDYVRGDVEDIDANEVLNFIEKSNQQLSCGVDDISVFLLYYPSSYFLVGGTGHWSYAVNENLFDDKSDSGSEGYSEGGYHKYNPRVTKKIKNKYHKKSSSKPTKKHKRTKKMKNRKGKKKTIKNGL